MPLPPILFLKMSTNLPLSVKNKLIINTVFIIDHVVMVANHITLMCQLFSQCSTEKVIFIFLRLLGVPCFFSEEVNYFFEEVNEFFTLY